MKINDTVFYDVVVIFLFVIGIYYPNVFAGFNSIDDYKMINSLLNLDGFSFKHIFIPNGYGQYYRPLLYLSFIGDKYIWGLEASFMHLENTLLHLGNTLLVFWLARQIISLTTTLRSHPYFPLVAALLFGLHPIATEPVNWVSGRTDLMAGFFALLALGSFLICMNRFQRSIVSNYLFGFFGALSLLAGCLSKETALFILPVILAWCVFPPKDNTIPSTLLRIYTFLLYGLAGSVYLVLRWLALSGGDKIVKTVVKVSSASGSPAEASVGVLDVACVISKTAGFYFKKLIIPVPLNFGINSISPHYFWLGLLVLGAIAWCLYRRNTVAYLFLAAFMLTSSAFILPILKITWTPIAERYVYMASAPFIIGVTVLYIKYIADRISARVTTLVVAAVLGSAAVVTAQRNIIWQDNFTLFEDTMKKSPDFGVIKNEYAIALRARGRIEEADKIMLANTVDEFQPSSLNKIRIFVNQGKLDEARVMLLERLKKPSDYDIMSYELLLKIDETRRTKTITEGEKKNFDRNIMEDLLKMATITGDPFYHYRLGTVQLRLADKKSAKASFEKAYLNSSKNSHYHEAAKKLAEKL